MQELRAQRHILVFGVAAITLMLGSSSASADEFDAFDDMDDGPKETPAPTSATSAVTLGSKVDKTTISLGVGGMVATRDLSVEGDTRDLTHKPAAYLGGTLDLSLYFAHIKSLDAFVGIVGQGGYGTSKNAEPDSVLMREPITEMMFGQAALAIARPFSESAHLEVALGVQGTSFLVERNADYTGHRYTSGLIGATLRGALLDKHLLTSLELALLPNLSTNESNLDAQASSLGFRAGGQLGWSFAPSSGLRMSKTGILLRYTFQRFRGQYDAASRFGANATSQDTSHIMGLTLHYSL